MRYYQWSPTGMRAVDRLDCEQQYVRAEDADRVPDPPRARSTDPETSHIAARLARAGYSDLDRRIQGVLRDLPRNSYEVSVELDEPIEYVSPRFAPLERAGYIRKNGVRRPGHSGVRLANVYEVIE